jgi:hypothetical protein
MASYILIGLVSPVEGKVQPFADWHENQHIPEVLRTPGFVRCSRYCSVEPHTHNSDWPLMAIYEIETEDFALCMSELKARIDDGRISPSPYGDPTKRTILSWQLLSQHAA